MLSLASTSEALTVLIRFLGIKFSTSSSSTSSSDEFTPNSKAVELLPDFPPLTPVDNFLAQEGSK